MSLKHKRKDESSLVVSRGSKLLKTITDKLGVIEDDLTGATDAGVQFKKQGLETVVLVGIVDLGLVAGEALMGVVIAILIVMGINLSLFSEAPLWPGLLMWLYIAILLAYIPIREIINQKNR